MIATLFLAAFLAQQDDARTQMEQSIARQKAAIQKQAGGDGFFTPGFFTTMASPDCPPLEESAAEPLIQTAAKDAGVEAAVLRAMVRQESGFRPCAVSAKGAMGLMQLMPDTADLLHLADVFDAAHNLDAGAHYLKRLLDRFKGNLSLALAAYNAGPEKVDGKVPEIPETKDYVDRILKAVEAEQAKKKTKP